jgi:hypothetical protein
MALQCAADVFLDPFPFGGGVTVLEALACPSKHPGAHQYFRYQNEPQEAPRAGSGRVAVVSAPRLQTVPHLAAGIMLLAWNISAADGSLSELGAIARDGAHYAAEAVRLASRNQGSAGAADAANQNETAVTGVEGRQASFAAARSDGDEGKVSLWESEAAANAWAAFLARIAH